MKLPREYKKFIGNYAACRNAYGRKMLRKFGFGPETEIVKEVVETVKPKKTKKKSTK
jgi:hypothetical protein